uniref:Ig-like domain-containing protein n=1 Tax=Junco hyemalis TaxID=40217 RepID=A0A8C5J001_JUNHY
MLGAKAGHRGEMRLCWTGALAKCTNPALPQTAASAVPRTDLTVREGEEFTFQCSMKEGDMSSYYMYWYRQGPWSSLQWIYESLEDTYGAGFQDRFKGRVQSSKNSFTLQLLAPELGDAATYYCGAEPPWSSSAAE